MLRGDSLPTTLRCTSNLTLDRLPQHLSQFRALPKRTSPWGIISAISAKAIASRSDRTEKKIFLGFL